MDELLYTVWLSLACTPGSETFIKLLNKFNNSFGIYSATPEAIASCISSKSKDYNSLTDKSTKKAEEILNFCKSKKVGILTYFDKNYPDSLKNIKNPPVLLYYRGVLPDFNNNFFVSVVGTRRNSDYGRKNTFKISSDIAKAGATVVSGMAIGIDGVALAGALAAGRSTVAVIGSGIDVCYPPQHKRLAREIVKEGCVFTEYAPGTRPLKHNFPKRNRIISALSSATVVMEGDERSGSLITARCAFEQGRKVYAFPGNVGNRGSEASNLLIKNGAALITSADDIIRDFDKISPSKLNPHLLSKHSLLNMNEVLCEFEVSCVAPSDDIFRTTRKKKKSENREASVSSSDNVNSSSKKNEVISTLNPSCASLYNKIPENSDCSIDRLVDVEHNLRDVMQGILKLEILGVVTMLPGDRVKRNQ
ncbi:MAG: DNA-protecting protein DprA [Ruminococcaceae bacterium]|nr:DNA-protecting protein DprA [Oscillospiraceae bacterium]